MRITLRQLQIFVAIANFGSTAAAATAVNLTQSASSAALRELESALNCPLFDRVGKRLLLNEEGRRLLPKARLLLDAAAHIEEDFELDNRPSLTGVNLACSTTVGIHLMPRLLARYQLINQAQPDKVTIANTDDVVHLIANYEADIGFIEGYCRNSQLEVQPWLKDELVIVCAPSHPLATTGSQPDLAMLRGAHWLLREPGSGTREAMEHALLPHLHRLTPAAEFNNSEAIKNAALAGLGLACLSRLIVAELIQQNKLVVLDTQLPPVERQLYIISSRNKNMSTRLTRFLSFCKSWNLD